MPPYVPVKYSTAPLRKDLTVAGLGAGIAVVGGVVSYASGRGYVRWIGTALGLLAVSGLTRLLEYWIAQGTGGVS